MGKIKNVHKTKLRDAERKELGRLPVSDITAIDNFALLVREAFIVDISAKGLLLQIHRDHIVPKTLRGGINLDDLIGEHIMISIDIMDLDIDGFVTRTKYAGNNTFEIGIDYSQGTPEYWRECLVDLMPSTGDLNED